MDSSPLLPPPLQCLTAAPCCPQAGLLWVWMDSSPTAHIEAAANPPIISSGLQGKTQGGNKASDRPGGIEVGGQGGQGQ